MTSPTEQRIKEMEGQIDELLLKYTDRHPDVIAMRETVERLKAKAKSERKEFLANKEDGDSSGDALAHGGQLSLWIRCCSNLGLPLGDIGRIGQVLGGQRRRHILQFAGGFPTVGFFDEGLQRRQWFFLDQHEFHIGRKD